MSWFWNSERKKKETIHDIRLKTELTEKGKTVREYRVYYGNGDFQNVWEDENTNIAKGLRAYIAQNQEHAPLLKKYPGLAKLSNWEDKTQFKNDSDGDLVDSKKGYLFFKPKGK